MAQPSPRLPDECRAVESDCQTSDQANRQSVHL